MMEQKNEQAVAALIEIPPLPAGGAWRWDGTKWVEKSDPTPPAAPTPSTTKE